MPIVRRVYYGVTVAVEGIVSETDARPPMDGSFESIEDFEEVMAGTELDPDSTEVIDTPEDMRSETQVYDHLNQEWLSVAEWRRREQGGTA